MTAAGDPIIRLRRRQGKGSPRPVHFDPSTTTLFPTPAHPDYPSAHATQGEAAEAVLAHLFPRDAAYFAAWAEELAASRLWAGIHFRSACDAGLALGRAVGRRAA